MVWFSNQVEISNLQVSMIQRKFLKHEKTVEFKFLCMDLVDVSVINTFGIIYIDSFIETELHFLQIVFG